MQAAVRSATLSGYPDLVRSLGLDPMALMADVGLDVADLETPDRWIPGVRVARLLELSAQRTGCEDFALRLAGLRQLGALGPLSVVLRDEPDLRGALRLLARYDDIYTGVLDLRLEEDEQLATVRLWLRFGQPVPTRQALDLTTAILVGIVRRLVRSDWTPQSAYFAHRPPADPTPFVRVFGPRLRFDHEFTGWSFPVRELDSPVVLSDASVRPYSLRFLETLLARRASTASDQARDVVELLLPTGRASIGEVSGHLGLSPRVLQRRLAHESTSFSALMHATRGAMAERYLAADHHSLTDISHLLGFAAPSAFSRWFHQQFGTSPTEWRRAARGDGGRARTVPPG